MESMITAAPRPRGALLQERDSSSSSNSHGALDTCGYLSGDYGMIPEYTRALHRCPSLSAPGHK